MEKNNTLILIIIGIATLLVVVVGATFAFFTAQGDDETNEVTFNAQAESGSSQFTALFQDDSISIDIGLLEMQEGDDNEDAGKTANIYFDVTLTSVNSNTTTTCPFNIYYTWTGDGNNYGTDENPQMYYYKKTDEKNIPVEFDYQFYGSNGGKSQARRHVPETLVSGAKPILFFSDSITSSNGSVPTEQNYRIRVSFYNHKTISQDIQKGKVFSGTFSVDVGNCTYTAITTS